jgi:hypothetical protein
MGAVMTATLLAFPPAAMGRLVSTVRLLHLDGRPFASTGFLPGNPGAQWEWIQETVAAELGADPESIHATDDDLVTVEGIPCFTCEIRRPRHLC